MKRRLLVHALKLIVIFFALITWTCTYSENSGLTQENNSDTIENINTDINEDNIDISEDDADIYKEDILTHPDPSNPCINCEWYFCPPLDSVWQKEYCFNICDDPPTVVWETECVEYLECDPTQYLIDMHECITEDGYPGIQEEICDKGHIKFTNCVTECFDEICDYIDNDCDGVVDNGVLNTCGNCGPVPEESCNGIDDNCDGLTDEDQLNACDMCGLIPSEECNGIDDDCNGSTDENLIQPCSTECGAGYELCAAGNWISCNAPQPQVEICDGLDNNCDGQIDEDLECVCTIQDVGVLFPCQDEPLLCGQGFKTCQCSDSDCTLLTMTECYALCYWVPSADPSDICDPYTGMILEDEKCNNFDDNCNKLIDEDLYTACYTGPAGTLSVGICIPGEMTCDAGTWGNYNEDEDFIPFYCKDEITPQEEICNGLDDDCDGIADWGEEMKDTDVLFIVDWSGSMGDEMSAVMIALNQFAQNFSDEDVIKWAFMRGPVAVLPSTYNERLELVQDLIGFSDYLASLTGMDTSMQSMSTALEMLLDAIYISVHNITATLPHPIGDLQWAGTTTTNGMGSNVIESEPPLQNFDISWRPGAERVIIVFSDEYPQSFLVPKLSLEEVKTAVSGTPQLKLYTFSRSGADKIQWEQLADAGNGKWFKLTNNPTEMYVSLMEIIDEICKGGQSE
tara:strand:+ start:81 stop:2129 length:2049 start_codon:yes stop_codon:yes gene_type:complete